MKTVRCGLVVCLVSILSASIVNSQSLQQNLWVTNGEVNAVVFDGSTNTVFLGGAFTNVGPHTGLGALLDSTGRADLGFPRVNPTGVPTNGAVRAVAPDGSGGWYIGGGLH